MAESLVDPNLLDRVPAETDLSNWEPPSRRRRKKTGRSFSEGEEDSFSEGEEGSIDDLIEKFIDKFRRSLSACKAEFKFLHSGLEPPSSGKSSLEIEGGLDDNRSNDGEAEVGPVAVKCCSNTVQPLSASLDDSGCLDVNLRTEDRHPLTLPLLQFRVLRSIHLPYVGTIFGDLVPFDALMTDGLFSAQLSYVKKNNMHPLPLLVKSTPEAEDLFSRLLKKNLQSRPEGEVFLHPYFWSSEVKLYFLCEFSDRLQLKDPAPHPNLLKELERNKPPVFDGNWMDKIDQDFQKVIRKWGPNSSEGMQRYTSSVVGLLRVMRNNNGHYWALTEVIKNLLGGRWEGLYGYFAARFPSLLMKSYRAASQFCSEEEWFKEFHRKTGLLLNDGKSHVIYT